MKILKEERAIPQPQYETVTTYELTQEEMYVLLVAAGCTSRETRRKYMTDQQALFFGEFYGDHINTVMENQP